MHASVQIPHELQTCVCVCVCVHVRVRVCVPVRPVESGLVDFDYLVSHFVLHLTSALKSVVVLSFSPKSVTMNRYQVACE